MPHTTTQLQQKSLHRGFDVQDTSQAVDLNAGQGATHFWPLVICFVLSGMAGLIYETAWTREFALVFGASEVAVAVVLAAYMAGLMVGAALGGWLLGRIRNLVWAYAGLELGIAVCALAVPSAIQLAGRLQQRLFRGLDLAADGGSLALVLFDLASSFLILLPATAMMGATLPLLASHAVQRDAELGSRIATLYTANTAGAAAGTLLAAFVLLPSLGLGLTVSVAVGLNVLVFILAAWLARSSLSVHPAQPRMNALSNQPEDHASEGRSSERWWILPLILLSGFVALTYEVLWTRLLSHLLGGSLYAFAIQLATFLLGLALGSALASRWARNPEQARFGFICAQLGVGVTFAAAFAIVDFLPSWLARSALEDAAFLAGGAVLAGVTLLPGAIFLGASFPFAVRILAGDAQQAGVASARVFAWNTFGAICGALVAGFLLLPNLRYAGTAQLTIAISLVLALVAAWSKPRRRGALAVALLGLSLVIALPPQTPWQVLRTSPFTGKAAAGDIAFYEVGRGSTVLLLEQFGEWRLTTNGLPESAIQTSGARLSRFNIAHWLGRLPHLANPDVRSTLVIGLGAGITLSAIPETVREVHLVELEAAVLDANRSMADVRERDPLTDPRLKVHLDDARSALLLSDRRFDAIVSQPSHPWTAGASHLFTQEFFALVADHLEDDGVFVQWIGLRFIDEPLLRSLLATLNAVFPHVEVFDPAPGGALLFLAGRQPLEIEKRVAHAFGDQEASWQRMGLHTAEDLLIARVLDEKGMLQLAAEAPISTDHRNLLQTRSPWILHESLGVAGTNRLLSDLDPLLSWSTEKKIYAVRRLLAEKRLFRARALADSIVDSTAHDLALAFVELTEGKRQRAEPALWRALEKDGVHLEALAALMQLYQAPLARGFAPPALEQHVAGDAIARTIAEAWRLAGLQNVETVAQLDDTLRSIDGRHPLFTAAMRLRVGWRQAVGDPVKASEGLDLFDGLIAVGGASDRDLLQRALLASRAERPDVALASAHELANLLVRKPRLADSRPRMIRILQSVLPPEDPRLIHALKVLNSVRGERASRVKEAARSFPGSSAPPGREPV